MLPNVGDAAPEFTLTGEELNDVTLQDFAGKRVVLNVFPSIDTPTCAASVRRFNEEAASLDNTVVITASKDLPFALSRFCGAEGIENVVATSAFRSTFGVDYGVEQGDGDMHGLFARAVIVVDESGKVAYTQIVPEIADEPDYEPVLAALK